MIAVREFKTGAECIANAAAVRKRLFNPANSRSEKPVLRIVSKPEPVFVPDFIGKRQMWKREPIYFDAHLLDWREYLMAKATPLKAYICRRSAELGFSYSMIVSKSRKRDLVKVRHLIMWEVKRLVKPSITLPELGRLFGGFDHTSCLHGIRLVDELKAKQLGSNEPAGESR